MSRAILFILDGLGVGEAPDAGDYHDKNADTLGHLLKATGNIVLNNLEYLGLGHLGHYEHVRPLSSPGCFFGKAVPLACGKDTVTGHWEIAGVIPSAPFRYFPNGFPCELIDEFCKINQLTGCLGNVVASGTEIINQYGNEHQSTLKPIVYTSADSVFQIACHEQAFGLDRLYQVCEKTRQLCDAYNIARVIARPFVQENDRFIRTRDRKDYTMAPPGRTVMEALQSRRIRTIGFGKVPSIFNYCGFDEHIPTTSNQDGMIKLMTELEKNINGFYFINLIDFDMLFGHRRDFLGYAEALVAFDVELGKLLTHINEDDLLIITADHGNDPTYIGTDHTREKIPILSFQKSRAGGRRIGEVSGFFHISATIYQFLTGQKYSMGYSFIEEDRS